VVLATQPHLAPRLRKE